MGLLNKFIEIMVQSRKYSEDLDEKDKEQFLIEIINDIESDLNRISKEIERIKGTKKEEVSKPDDEKKSSSLNLDETFKIKLDALVTEQLEFEQTIASLEAEDISGELYPLAYPPVDLVDVKINKAILNSKFLTPPLFILLRTITHPYRRELPLKFKYYLDYLIEAEEWDINWIKYLLTGTNTLSYSPSPLPKNEDESIKDDVNDFLSQVDEYLELIQSSLNCQTEAPRIDIELTEKVFSIKVTKKEMIFYPEHGIEKWQKYMDYWGIYINAIRQNLKIV